MSSKINTVKFSLSMLIFGTIGIFVKGISAPSSTICMFRGLFGALFLELFILIFKKPFSFLNVKKNLLPLLVSGVCIGFNWILLFESYNYVSVATATLCYYMAPVMLIIASLFLFKEKISALQSVCIILSVVGIFLISDIFSNGGIERSQVKGIVFGLVSAAIYTVIIILNKMMKEISQYEKTVVQLITCGVVMFVYSFSNGDIRSVHLAGGEIGLLALVCIVHTGIAYVLYFGSMEGLSAKNIALLSYIDPVVAVILSAIIVEPISVCGIIGAVFIIGSALVSQCFGRN